MRWGVEYRQNDGGMTGLIIFTAEDLRAANAYVDMMGAQYGFNDVSNLQQIANGASMTSQIYNKSQTVHRWLSLGDYSQAIYLKSVGNLNVEITSE